VDESNRGTGCGGLLDQVERTGARGELAAALAKAQAEFAPIKKTRTAQLDSYSYEYATLSDVYAATRPALTKHGLALAHTLSSREGVVYLRTVLLHTSGEELASEVPVPLASGARLQQFGGALTYLERYQTSALLGVASEDDLDGVDAGKVPSSARPEATPATKRPRAAKPAAAPPASAKPARLDQVTHEQVLRLWSIATDVANRMQVRRKLVEEKVRAWLADLGFASTSDLTPAAYEKVCQRLEALDLTALAASKREAACAPAPEAPPEEPPPPDQAPEEVFD